MSVKEVFNCEELQRKLSSEGVVEVELPLWKGRFCRIFWTSVIAFPASSSSMII
ncbi:hypothetical protein [Zooshikella sp. RANM57]|uniref:hypothetical protein n=1 Tax=Zooshikella sp. RANM57 TaxID=3425863 RepID=UPI003D6F85B8